MTERAEPYVQKISISESQYKLDQLIKFARTALGDNAYTAAYRAGQQTSLDDAIAYTLKEFRP
jgi:hypothetical protein